MQGGNGHSSVLDVVASQDLINTMTSDESSGKKLRPAMQISGVRVFQKGKSERAQALRLCVLSKFEVLHEGPWLPHCE